MTELKQVYKCAICGNIVEVVHTGAGELTCCGEPMSLLVENTVDPSTPQSDSGQAGSGQGAVAEKHVPVIEKTDKGIVVKVGEVPHPMEESHYIEWIEATLIGGELFRKWLKPGDAPEMAVCTCDDDKCNCEVKEAREYCNLHGSWKA